MLTAVKSLVVAHMWPLVHRRMRIPQIRMIECTPAPMQPIRLLAAALRLNEVQVDEVEAQSMFRAVKKALLRVQLLRCDAIGTECLTQAQPSRADAVVAEALTLNQPNEVVGRH
jgi:hypothetical protein